MSAAVPPGELLASPAFAALMARMAHRDVLQYCVLYGAAIDMVATGRTGDALEILRRMDCFKKKWGMQEGVHPWQIAARKSALSAG